MKLIFSAGDKKEYTKVVTQDDAAAFHGKLVHPVYATFSLARDFEWTSRLFFIDMREDDEEGVGTELTIKHHKPALVGEEVKITATIDAIIGNELICIIEARCGDRLIASGKTGQKMLKKEKLKKMFGHG